MFISYWMMSCLYFLLQFSNAEDRASFPRPTSTYYFAGGAYNPDSEFCCNGVSGPYDSIYSPMCCGKAAYDSSRQICCENKVFPLEVGKICCGNYTIDTSSEICCYGVSYPRSSNSVRCCKNITYDPVTEVCCPFNIPSIISKDGDSSRTACCGKKKVYNPTTEICCVTSSEYDEEKFQAHYRVAKKSKPTDQLCCGNVTYGYNTNFCCGGKLYGHSFACCGGEEPFSTRTHSCCSKHFMSRDYEVVPNSLRCCGSKSYDPDKQVCCNGKIFENPDSRKLECCMGDIYDSDTEMCCFNHDAKPYNNGTSVTRPTIIRKTSNDNRCCGVISYNDTNQICCLDYRTGKQYLARKLSPFAYECCGDVGYGYQDGICCGGANDNWKTEHRFHKFQSSYPYDIQCCGDQTYNRSSSICCGGLILDSSDGKAACCGNNRSYNRTTQTCCIDTTKYPYATKVHDKLVSGLESNQCCGVHLYDSSMEICCKQNLYKLNDGMSCCGNKVYNLTTELCCANDVITKLNENQNACCYDYTDSLQDGYGSP